MTKGIFAGSFDLCHAGHILAFKEARGNCEYLTVAIQSNPHADRPEKNTPIMGINERKIILQGIRYIDEIVEYDTETDLMALVEKTHPDIYFMGEDWKGKDSWHEPLMKKLGIRIHYLKRDHTYSSSELRRRIVAAEK